MKTQESEWLGTAFNTDNTILNGNLSYYTYIKDEIKMNSPNFYPHPEKSTVHFYYWEIDSIERRKNEWRKNALLS